MRYTTPIHPPSLALFSPVLGLPIEEVKQPQFLSQILPANYSYRPKPRNFKIVEIKVFNERLGLVVRVRLGLIVVGRCCLVPRLERHRQRLCRAWYNSSCGHLSFTVLGGIRIVLLTRDRHHPYWLVPVPLFPWLHRLAQVLPPVFWRKIGPN